MTPLRLASIIEVAAMFALTAAFVLLYALRSPWWRSAMGRNLMGFSASLGLVLGLILVSWLTHPLPRLVWVVAMFPLVVVLAGRLRLLLQAQRRD